MWALINEAKANEQATGQQRTEGADPAGQVSAGQGQGLQAATEAASQSASQGEVDLFGTVPVQEQAMADRKRKVDENLRGTSDTPATEPFGDLLSPGRAQQTEVPTQTPAGAGRRFLHLTHNNGLMRSSQCG